MGLFWKYFPKLFFQNDAGSINFRAAEWSSPSKPTGMTRDLSGKPHGKLTKQREIGPRNLLSLCASKRLFTPQPPKSRLCQVCECLPLIFSCFSHHLFDVSQFDWSTNNIPPPFVCPACAHVFSPQHRMAHSKFGI